MDISSQGIAAPAWLPADSLPRHFSILFAAAVFLLLLLVSLRPTAPKRAPALPETIPYISNTYQYMTNMSKLLARARYLPPHFLFLVSSGTN